MHKRQKATWGWVAGLTVMVGWSSSLLGCGSEGDRTTGYMTVPDTDAATATGGTSGSGGSSGEAGAGSGATGGSGGTGGSGVDGSATADAGGGAAANEAGGMFPEAGIPTIPGKVVFSQN